MVKIESSKTDQYREGASLVIARTGQVTCLVAMMERYCRMGEVDQLIPGKVFRGIVHTKSGERLRKNGGLSYARLRELLLEKLSQLVSTQRYSACIACGQGVLQRQPMPVWKIDFSRGMAVGSLNQPKIVTS